MIAPFWADVDTRLGAQFDDSVPSSQDNDSDVGRVWYREVVDEQLLVRVQTDIRAAFIQHANFTPSWMFIVTWDEVGYYNRHKDKVH